jgi:hypothetical protein
MIQGKKRLVATKLFESFSSSGLPDGLISNQKSQFGLILDDLRLESVVIFFGHLEYFTDIWDI